VLLALVLSFGLRDDSARDGSLKNDSIRSELIVATPIRTTAPSR
jgi:hypothetical protein